jgi:hypothetical protein
MDFLRLTQWDQFITPTIIKTFYTLLVGFLVLLALSGILAGLAAMATNPFFGFIVILASLVGVAGGVVGARIACELVLITFRINEHLGAIRDRQ